MGKLRARNIRIGVRKNDRKSTFRLMLLFILPQVLSRLALSGFKAKLRLHHPDPRVLHASRSRGVFFDDHLRQDPESAAGRLQCRASKVTEAKPKGSDSGSGHERLISCLLEPLRVRVHPQVVPPRGNLDRSVRLLMMTHLLIQI